MAVIGKTGEGKPQQWEDGQRGTGGIVPEAGEERQGRAGSGEPGVHAKDNYSRGIGKAGNNTEQFAGKAIGAVNRVDKAFSGTAAKAARIFVTGEVAEDYIGDAATRLLVNVNDVYYKNNAGAEPLFINTRNSTVRMTRFDPEIVWRSFHPDILVGLVQDEIDRLGVDMDPWKMDYFDFYQNMVAAMKDTHGEAVAVIKKGTGIDDFYHGIYLSCLLLFGKPGYMDVPVAEHFAQKDAADFLRGAGIFQLNEPGREKLEGLRKDYGSLQAITNPEIQFVVDLYEGVLK
jgi:hypothetical protein